MQTSYTKRTQKMVTIAIFAAIIIVLQFLSCFVKIGPVSITLTLIPVVLGGILLGKGAGAVLGFVFGFAAWLFACVMGLDVGSAMLLAANPVLCTLLCILKGVIAGWGAAFVAQITHRCNKLISSVLAAITAPILNTGVFLIGARLFFYETVSVWAGGKPTVYYFLIGLTGINFLVELIINLVFSAAILHLTKISKLSTQNE